MKKNADSRRGFLKSVGAGVPAAVLSMEAGATCANGAVVPSGAPAQPASPSGAGTSAASAVLSPNAGDGSLEFLKHTIDLGFSETCAVADVNNDGKLEIVSGEHWFEKAPPSAPGLPPRWIRHKFRTLPYLNFYLDNFSDLPVDAAHSGYADIVSCSWFSKQITWYRNPGNANEPWKETVIQSGYPVEFAFLVDILNTGKPLQILPEFGDAHAPLSWYELMGEGADAHWVHHQVSSQSYGHGIGAGDVNGDGRTDIITPQGWFEAPADPRSGQWIFHPEFDLGTVGFIHVHDVNGDGLADLVTSAAHGYGVFWYEQRKETDGKRSWVKHVIDDSWSQAHALTLADLNGDGQMELITGKRYFAHNGHDPGSKEPLGIYWYQPIRVNGELQWKRHLIDYSSRAGGGMQIPVVDLAGNGSRDVLVAGKSGLFWFENITRSYDRAAALRTGNLTSPARRFAAGRGRLGA